MSKFDDIRTGSQTKTAKQSPLSNRGYEGNAHLRIIRSTTISGSLIDFCGGMLKELSEKYEVVALSTPGPALIELAEKEGVRTIAVPMERHISLWRDWISLWRMVRVFMQERPTMVHSMTPKAGMICMVAAWLTRVPVRVHTFTGLVWPTSTGLKRKILMFTDWLTCACATHIIPEGEGVKNNLINGGITKKPLRVLGHGSCKGIDLEYFQMREELREKSEKLREPGVFTFLFVGRITRDKGINELVEAFVRLHREYPQTRLVLVGRYEDSLDPVKLSTKALIEQVDNDIEAVGEKFGGDLLACYAAADCFVLPSYREGFPNTVLEAGAMGLPCIVTDINGSREIISLTPTPSPIGEEGKDKGSLNGMGLQIRSNGIVVPPQNVDMLYEAMWRMANDSKMRESMASKARPMIAERFDMHYVRQCLYEFYEVVLGEKRTRIE